MKFFSVFLVLIFLSACSGRQIYDAGQGWRQNECNNMIDAGKQRECLEQANKPYEVYDRERRDVKHKP